MPLKSTSIVFSIFLSFGCSRIVGCFVLLCEGSKIMRVKLNYAWQWKNSKLAYVHLALNVHLHL